MVLSEDAEVEEEGGCCDWRRVEAERLRWARSAIAEELKTC